MPLERVKQKLKERANKKFVDEIFSIITNKHLKDVLKYVYSLSFEDEPDYNYIIRNFKKTLDFLSVCED